MYESNASWLDGSELDFLVDKKNNSLIFKQI